MNQYIKAADGKVYRISESNEVTREELVKAVDEIGSLFERSKQALNDFDALQAPQAAPVSVENEATPAERAAEIAEDAAELAEDLQQPDQQPQPQPAPVANEIPVLTTTQPLNAPVAATPAPVTMPNELIIQ